MALSVSNMATLKSMEKLIRDKIEGERWSHKKLSEFLKEKYPGGTGFSVRSIQRFCSVENIHKTSRLSSIDLDTSVADAIAKVNR